MSQKSVNGVSASDHQASVSWIRHSKDASCMAFNSDNVRIWNRNTKNCISTSSFNSQYAKVYNKNFQVDAEFHPVNSNWLLAANPTHVMLWNLKTFYHDHRDHVGASDDDHSHFQSIMRTEKDVQGAIFKVAWYPYFAPKYICIVSQNTANVVELTSIKWTDPADAALEDRLDAMKRQNVNTTNPTDVVLERRLHILQQGQNTNTTPTSVPSTPSIPQSRNNSTNKWTCRLYPQVPIQVANFSADHTHFALASRAGDVFIWRRPPESIYTTSSTVSSLPLSYPTPEPQVHVQPHKSAITAICFTPVPDRIVIASADHIIRIVHIETKTVLATLKSHTALIHQVDVITPLKVFGQNSAFPIQITVVASVSHDGTAVIWDATQGDADEDEDEEDKHGDNQARDANNELVPQQERQYLIYRWIPHVNKPVTAVRFTPDGGSLCTGGKDGAVRQWKIPTMRKRNPWATTTHDRIMEEYPNEGHDQTGSSTSSTGSMIKKNAPKHDTPWWRFLPFLGKSNLRDKTDLIHDPPYPNFVVYRPRPIYLRLLCPLCLQDYDSALHKPMINGSCGHTFACSLCNEIIWAQFNKEISDRDRLSIDEQENFKPQSESTRTNESVKWPRCSLCKQQLIEVTPDFDWCASQSAQPQLQQGLAISANSNPATSHEQVEAMGTGAGQSPGKEENLQMSMLLNLMRIKPDSVFLRSSSSKRDQNPIIVEERFKSGACVERMTKIQMIGVSKCTDGNTDNNEKGKNDETGANSKNKVDLDTNNIEIQDNCDGMKTSVSWVSTSDGQHGLAFSVPRVSSWFVNLTRVFSLRHSNVHQIFGFVECELSSSMSTFMCSKHLTVIGESMEGGNLAEALARIKNTRYFLSPSMCVNILQQLVSALVYLDERNIWYPSLKAEDVFLSQRLENYNSQNFRVKISCVPLLKKPAHVIEKKDGLEQESFRKALSKVISRTISHDRYMEGEPLWSDFFQTLGEFRQMTEITKACEEGTEPKAQILLDGISQQLRIVPTAPEIELMDMKEETLLQY